MRLLRVYSSPLKRVKVVTQRGQYGMYTTRRLHTTNFILILYMYFSINASVIGNLEYDDGQPMMQFNIHSLLECQWVCPAGQPVMLVKSTYDIVYQNILWLILAGILFNESVSYMISSHQFPQEGISHSLVT